MPYKNIRLYCKSQNDLAIVLREYIDIYFQGKISDDKLEDKTISVIEANKDKFYKENIIA